MSIDVRLLQPENALLPMDVTLSPSITSFTDFIPLNQLPTVGHRIVTEVRPLHP